MFRSEHLPETLLTTQKHHPVTQVILASYGKPVDTAETQYTGYLEWTPLSPDVNDLDPLDAANSSEAEDEAPAVVLGKRKTYESSTSQMHLWQPIANFFLDELVCHDGLGDYDRPTHSCALCERCYALGDDGPDTEWNGTFWLNITLADLGYAYQLGHGGMPCCFSDSWLLTMTVIELPVIHRVRYCYCKKSDHMTNLQQLLRNTWYPATITNPATCATFTTLETFCLQNVIANMNANDFITAIKRQTNVTASTGMDWVPHRYKEFMCMSRQWAFLMRAKRASRAHDPTGVAGMPQRELAVWCWVCPHDKRNLPPGWRDMDKKFCSKIECTPTNIQTHRWGRAGGISWNLKNISNISGNQYLYCLHRPTAERQPRNGWPTDVGGQFANMDYIALGALAGFALLWLTIFYDISCQWKTQLEEQNAKLPKEMQLLLDKIKVQCALPVWHATSPEEDCASANSLSFKPGVGKSDSEGIEHTWSVLNSASYHTKDMGKGNRVDMLDDKIDSHNYLKNFGLGDALCRKLAVAHAEWDRQVAAFKQVCKMVEVNVMQSWQEDQMLKDLSRPNPYILERRDGPTVAQVWLQLKQDEEKELIGGRAALHGTSATAFLTAGLQIEQAQRRIIADVAATQLVTADREQKIQELRLTSQEAHDILSHNREGRGKVRRRYASIPDGAHQALHAEQAACRRARGGVYEKAARNGGEDRHLITFRNEHITGQIKSTKARTLIGQVGDQVNMSAEKYRKALVTLKGLDYAPHFHELKDNDIRLEGDNGESDAAVKKKLAMITKASSGDEEQDLHDSVSVKWARAKARKTHWVEEAMILEDEMRRTLHYLEWQAAWWEERLDSRPGASPEVRAGVRTYALKQAAPHRHLAVHFKAEWDTSVHVDLNAVMEQADLAQFFTEDNQGLEVEPVLA
ncbi:hypothetical protein B0H19DRAFT_1058944 [Mycena capillaripes]|nr:hypothetical protein B0H19DRAFT_1058944 [Mycena capillaripes]